MELMFKWQDIGKRNRGLTYDDVLLVPSFSEVRSRRDPQLETQLTKNRRMRIPLISANMDTITEAPMAIAMMGGTISSTVLTLVVIPAFYIIIERLTEKFLGEPEETGEEGVQE